MSLTALNSQCHLLATIQLFNWSNDSYLQNQGRLRQCIVGIWKDYLYYLRQKQQHFAKRVDLLQFAAVVWPMLVLQDCWHPVLTVSRKFQFGLLEHLNHFRLTFRQPFPFPSDQNDQGIQADNFEMMFHALFRKKCHLYNSDKQHSEVLNVFLSTVDNTSMNPSFFCKNILLIFSESIWATDSPIPIFTSSF